MSESGEHEAVGGAEGAGAESAVPGSIGDRATLSGEETRMADTLEPGPPSDPARNEQVALTTLLKSDPNADPVARLVAHMSQRQLDMWDLLVQLRDDLERVKRHVGLS